MSRETLNLTPAVYQYLLDISLREPPILRRLREETAAHPNANLQISPDQGQFMALLVKLMGARRIIEVGVFTGYSSLWMALALPDDGRLVACDVNREWTGIARRYWDEAGIGHKVDLRLAPALDTMDALIAAGESDSYDLVFIDALKTEYADYYERALKLLRRGGLAVVDNTLWEGRLVDPAADDRLTVAIRDFNRKLAADERIDLSVLALGDGVTLARRR
jgi:caffeoyl-CoA O-methyltransferase